MPGKSKRKQLRYATNKQTVTAQAPAAAVASKPQVSSVKSPVAAKTVTVGYTPELLKHVGAELKMSIILSACILVVIIILAFILR